jgi:hypothetical protein
MLKAKGKGERACVRGERGPLLTVKMWDPVSKVRKPLVSYM